MVFEAPKMQISRFDSVINVIVETYVGGHIPYTL